MDEFSPGGARFHADSRESRLPLHGRLRGGETLRRTGLSRSSVYARMNSSDAPYDSSFPLPVAVSAKGSCVSNRWIGAEVDAWITNRPRTRAIVGLQGGRE
ncbi:AlpA family phage regulatory protein [Burkholderia pseudomallei]|nr:AlpA family phage regulatory protein [Burkholderia pseudomallei]